MNSTGHLGVVALLSLLAATVAPSSAMSVDVLNTVTIHQSHKYGYFPSVQMLSTGELICDFSLDADADDVEESFWGYVISRDHGRTWGMRNTAGFIYREAAYTRDPSLPDGSMLMVAGYPIPGPGGDFRNIHASSAVISDGGKTVRFSRDVEVHLPQPAATVALDGRIKSQCDLGMPKVKQAAMMLFCGTVTATHSGGWLATMYGKLDGDKFYRTIIIKSDAAARSWDYVSTVAGDAEEVAARQREQEKESEGFCEPRMIRLSDGRLFIVMRRGSNNAMYKAWSNDDGKTWTNLGSLGFRGVKPSMMEMKSGVLALCTGRPGPITVRFSTDAGATWQGATVIAGNASSPDANSPQERQKSTCYTGMVEVDPGTLFIVYDHLPFVEGWGLNPEKNLTAVNTVFGTFLRVTR